MDIEYLHKYEESLLEIIYEINCEDISIFKNVKWGICWLHSMYVSLFLSKELNSIVFAKIFVIKNNKLIGTKYPDLQTAVEYIKKRSTERTIDGDEIFVMPKTIKEIYDLAKQLCFAAYLMMENVRTSLNILFERIRKRNKLIRQLSREQADLYCGKTLAEIMNKLNISGLISFGSDSGGHERDTLYTLIHLYSLENNISFQLINIDDVPDLDNNIFNASSILLNWSEYADKKLEKHVTTLTKHDDNMYCYYDDNDDQFYVPSVQTIRELIAVDVMQDELFNYGEINSLIVLRLIVDGGELVHNKYDDNLLKFIIIVDHIPIDYYTIIISFYYIAFNNMLGAFIKTNLKNICTFLLHRELSEKDIKVCTSILEYVILYYKTSIVSRAQKHTLEGQPIVKQGGTNYYSKYLKYKRKYNNLKHNSIKYE